MPRKKTDKSTTPTNKRDAAKPNKSKTTPKGTVAEQMQATALGKPLQSTIGEQLLAKGKPPVNTVQVQNFTRRLPCALTEPQLIAYSRRAADIRSCVRREKEVVEAAKLEFERVKKDSESKCKTWENELQTLDDAITSDQEYRDVDCQRVFDYSKGAGEVREIRTDTGALLQDPRPMTVKEIEDGFTAEREPAAPAEDDEPDDDDDDEDDNDEIPFE